MPAAILLFLGLAALRIPLPHGAALTGALIYGVLNFAVGYALSYYGLQEVTAGTASVVMATVPVFTILLAAAHRVERFRGRALAGALVAAAGVAIVFADQLNADVPLGHLLAILGNAVVAAEAGITLKAFPRTHPLATNVVGMLAGGLLVGALSLVAGERQALPERPETQIALGYLATVGSIGLFVLFVFMLNRWTASASSYALVLMPLVAFSLGAALRGEAVSPLFLAGGIVVAAGVWLGALSGGGGTGAAQASGGSR